MLWNRVSFKSGLFVLIETTQALGHGHQIDSTSKKHKTERLHFKGPFRLWGSTLISWRYPSLDLFQLWRHGEENNSSTSELRVVVWFPTCPNLEIPLTSSKNKLIWKEKKLPRNSKKPSCYCRCRCPDTGEKPHWWQMHLCACTKKTLPHHLQTLPCLWLTSDAGTPGESQSHNKHIPNYLETTQFFMCFKSWVFCSPLKSKKLTAKPLWTPVKPPASRASVTPAALRLKRPAMLEGSPEASAACKKLCTA